jgi:AraC-like DNA-binding protein
MKRGLVFNLPLSRFVFSRYQVNGPSVMDQRVQNIITLIENNFAEHLSEADLARAVNLSSWGLCHLFKGETGKAPLQYLRTVRMEKARSLLETTFLSVKQIMRLVGLRDESHFVRDFRCTYGLSPAAYRARYWIHASAEQNRPIAKSANRNIWRIPLVRIKVRPIPKNSML